MTEKKEAIVKGHSFGASGFTLGIVSIVSLGLMGGIISMVGFVFCLIQQMKKPTKLSKVGLILNVAGFILSLLWIFVFAPQLAIWLQQKGITA